LSSTSWGAPEPSWLLSADAPCRQEFITAAAAASDPDWSSLGTPLSSSITTGVGLQEGALQLYHATLSSTPDWFKVSQQHMLRVAECSTPALQLCGTFKQRQLHQ
jgi:hypothetical protein